MPPRMTTEAPHVFSVSELVGRAHRCVEQNFPPLWVEGEITNLRLVSSGHAYFTLRDSQSILPVAMWRSALARQRHRLADGQTFRVWGRLGIYAAQGKFQLYAERAEPAGLGARMLQLEQLKQKLHAEGLFARERKRPLPAWPRVVGVVTSATGAAIHDILKVARRRCPVRILLAPAQVQGDDAAVSIVRALQRLQNIPGVDVIILGRGGGASEDLWAFNDEGLARAVAACRVPVVSAVGHEVDTTICDHVADVRAATPSHAAELVVPDRDTLAHKFAQLERRLVLVTKRRVLDERSRVELFARRLAAFGHRLVLAPRRKLDALRARLGQQHPRARLARDRRRFVALHARLLDLHPRHRLAAVRRRLLAAELALHERGRLLAPPARLRLARAAAALNALSPLAVLERGFSVVTTDTGAVVTDAARVTPGDALAIQLAHGSLDARVLATRPLKPAS
jgi:exodeoxyribonuclease VII large subunit